MRFVVQQLWGPEGRVGKDFAKLAEPGVASGPKKGGYGQDGVPGTSEIFPQFILLWLASVRSASTFLHAVTATQVTCLLYDNHGLLMCICACVHVRICVCVCTHMCVCVCVRVCT